MRRQAGYLDRRPREFDVHDVEVTKLGRFPVSDRVDIRQNTEDAIGPFELHDFFLYHFVRNGFDRAKILYLASHAKFSIPYDHSLIEQTLDTFIRRFFASQYKRSCVPDGPKVGSVSLSPRGDWRMPSDGNPDSF